MVSSAIRIGTRGSPLALFQANEVRDRLIARHGLDGNQIDIVIIKTTGDKVQDRPLREVGGKGLFSKEIEAALIDNQIDLAVHSVKDMETTLPAGLQLGCLLPREDVRDAFISPVAGALAALPKGAVVGTTSLRRQAQIKRLRPDLEIITFRGNVETRLRKLAEGQADATLLAYAGLRRLGLEGHVTSLIEPEELLPAAGQGAVGIEVREGDERMAELIAPLEDAETAVRVTAERAFLAALDGSCHTPIGALALVEGDRLAFHGIILTPDGGVYHEVERRGATQEAEAMGRDAGEELRAEAGEDFMAALQ